MFGVLRSSGSERPTRRSHKKSRNGCITCKERKLKCDEVKPVCGNCLRRFTTIEICDYGFGATFRKHGAVLHVPSKQGRRRASTGARDAGPLPDLRAGSRDPGSPRTTLPVTLRGEVLDPFRTHPASQIEGVNALMKYYLSRAVYKNFPWQPPSPTNPTMTYYVPLILEDEVLFHAILQLAARGLEGENKPTSQRRSTELMYESLRLLRLRIDSAVVEQTISDQTISTVAILAAIEHEKGNMTRLRMHMNGLKRMIRLRGGLQSIRQSSPMVANSVFW
ncbi:hypothetical protein PVAG01_04716 [Phlyctema vagabunda]|uniref:Zn(2)-C6 fungal-type domain-containing protein n=1 Tax=Phlyctema vagabunda TaxID=108571 RepID=A0ABR4PI50_9HELO